MKRFLLFAIVAVAPALSFAQDRVLPRVVKVTGTSDVKVNPDKAIIDVGISRQNISASAAKKAADADARQILSVLHNIKIDEEDIQTTYLSLQPEFDYRNGRVTYFLAEQSLTVTLRDLSKLDLLLEALIKAGGNRINSLRYETSELRTYRDEARELAIRAAREKAEALAKALGQSIGKAYSIEESPQYQAYNYGYLANSTAEAGVPAKSSPATAPGQRTVSASVTVCFDLI